MRVILIILFMLIGNVHVSAQLHSIEDFQWEKRLLIIFSNDQQELDNQLSQIKQLYSGFKERDLIVILMQNGRAEIWNEKSNGQFNYSDLLNQFNIDRMDDYVNILIGLDGKVKLRENNHILNNKLFSTIDAMPIRQREIWDDQ